jgi:DNA-binding transcriptional LysR family regulator
MRVGLHVTAFTEITSGLLHKFQAEHPDIEVDLETYGLTEPAAGLLDGRSDVAVVRPPVAAPGLEFQVLVQESRVFVLPADHPLAGRTDISLREVDGEPWVAAPPATDGTEPETWRRFWLPQQRTDGGPVRIGAVATTLDAWREHVAAGRGISLCPSSSERFYARPGIAFVPASDAAPCQVSLAWRGVRRRAAAEQLIRFAAANPPGS